VARDILLDNDGDILVGETSDISLRHSIRQDVKIRLQWFFEEWRFAPEVGMPYFEDVFVKNPNTDLIAQRVREEVMKADGVEEVRDVTVTVNNMTRKAAIKFMFITAYGSFREEVTIHV
jgi:hypothetical protein